MLLAEAGTGTGKTLAYLAPAVISEKRVVVSTGTRNLQDQIFFKDLVLLGRALGRPVNAALLKGQENYLCRRRLADLLRSPLVLAFAPRDVERLAAWLGRVAGERLVVVELGAGTAVPTVRSTCERLAGRLSARLVRINVREAYGPGIVLPLAAGAREGLARIDARLGGG